MSPASEITQASTPSRSTADSIRPYEAEFAPVLRDFSERHSKMRLKVEFLANNVFYPPLAGDPKPKRSYGVNKLKLLVDKNVFYASKWPDIKVPHSRTDVGSRMQAQLKQKVISAAHAQNLSALNQIKMNYDATVMSRAFHLTEFDLKDRSIRMRRLDPRFCFYAFSNENDNEVSAFWYAVPYTKEAIKDQWNIEPKQSSFSLGQLLNPDGSNNPIDGKDRYWVVFRWDATKKCVWVGDQWLEEPHNHLMDCMPVDTVAPFEDLAQDRKGGFFMDPLEEPQAEYNETLRRKSNIIRKLGNPPIVGKGIRGKQFDEVKRAMRGDGGFVGVGTNGGLEFLQLHETAMHDAHLAQIWQDMRDMAHFPTIAFGQPAGANVSGNAAHMYFQPTVLAIAAQWTRWRPFYESINAKILKLYKQFGKPGEQFEVYGYDDTGTFGVQEGASDPETEQPEMTPGYGGQGAFALSFTPEELGDETYSVVIPPSVTPQDEMAIKDFAMAAANSGFLPLVRAYELMGETDPEDLVELLAQQKQDPRLHPELMSQAANLLNAGAGGQPGPAGASAPQPNEPVTPDLATSLPGPPPGNPGGRPVGA